MNPATATHAPLTPRSLSPAYATMLPAFVPGRLCARAKPSANSRSVNQSRLMTISVLICAMTAMPPPKPVRPTLRNERKRPPSVAVRDTRLSRCRSKRIRVRILCALFPAPVLTFYSLLYHEQRRRRKKRGRPIVWASPCVKEALRLTLLKLEAHGQLNLALAEERAARRVHRREIGLEEQRRTGDPVEARVLARHLRAVEDVEAFCQKLYVLVLREAEATRDSQVRVHDPRQTEGVARQEREPGGSARTVNARSCTTRNAPRNRSGEGNAGVVRKDGRNGPTVEYCSPGLARAYTERVRVVDDAGDELVRKVEVRSSSFCTWIEGVEQVIGVRECDGSLTGVRGP